MADDQSSPSEFPVPDSGASFLGGQLGWFAIIRYKLIVVVPVTLNSTDLLEPKQINNNVHTEYFLSLTIIVHYLLHQKGSRHFFDTKLWKKILILDKNNTSTNSVGINALVVSVTKM